VAVCAALEDLDYYGWYLREAAESKRILYEAFDRLRVKYWPSAANFVLADFGGEARRTVEALTAREIFVRDKSDDPACPGCIRVTAGVVEHTRAVVAALEEIL
jgi:histidinol-phosphate aminotransferase